MSNKIIRKEESLMSDISIISAPLEINKYEGASIFGPSLFGYENSGSTKEKEIRMQDIEKYATKSNISCIFQSLSEDAKLDKWIANENDKEYLGGISQEEPQPKQKPIPKKPKSKPKRRRIRKGRRKNRKSKGEVKNETKNIPKNFGKAIICFIEKNQSALKKFVESSGLIWKTFLDDLLQAKKKINTIADLRCLWLSSKYAGIVRILSNKFLRQYGFRYVFNSRVSNITVHLKYRRRLVDAIVNPEQFKHIKQY